MGGLACETGGGMVRGTRLEERGGSYSEAVGCAAAMANQPGGTGAGDGDGRDQSWDERDEAVQLQNVLRNEGRRRGHGRWHSLGELAKEYRRMKGFAMEDLWMAATLAHRRGTRRFDCYWEVGQDGEWEVFVLLQPEHALNRRGR